MKKAKHTKTKHTGNTEPERFVDIYDSFAQHSATINGTEVLFELNGCGNEKIEMDSNLNVKSFTSILD